MKKLLPSFALFLIFSVVGQTISAQHYQVEKGLMKKDKVRPLSIIGNDAAGNIYAVGARKKMSYIIPLIFFNRFHFKSVKYVKKYDKDMNLVEDVPFTGTTNNFSPAQLDGTIDAISVMGFAGVWSNNLTFNSFIWQGEHYGISANKDKNNFCLVNFGLDASIRKTYPITYLPKGKSRKSKLIYKDVTWNFSPDSNYIIFVAADKLEEKKSKKAYISVFDRALNPIWHSSYSMPSKKSGTEFKSVTINNRAQVYMLSEKTNIKKGRSSITSMMYMDQNHLRPLFVPLKFGDQYADNVQLSMNKAGKPAIMGFYKTKNKKTAGYDGLLYGTVDSTGLVNVSKKEAFTPDMVSAVYSAREQKKIDKKVRKGKKVTEEPEFKFIEFLPTPDGGALAMAEEQYLSIETHTTYNSKGGSSTHTTYIYHYNDLMMVKLNSDLDIQWVKKVAKNNEIKLGYPVKPWVKDYAVCNMSSNFYVFINDHKGLAENVHSRKSKKSMFRAVSTYAVTVDKSGNLNRQEMIKAGEMGKYNLDIHRDVYAANNKIFFLATRNLRGSKSILGSVAIVDGKMGESSTE
ncbi:MAG: hypothetical protein ABI378_01555 [Chitinophagaceae bacterium]